MDVETVRRLQWHFQSEAPPPSPHRSGKVDAHLHGESGTFGWTCANTGSEVKSLFFPFPGLSAPHRLRKRAAAEEPTASSTLLCLVNLLLSQDVAPPLQQHPPLRASSPRLFLHLPRHLINNPLRSFLSLFLNLQFPPKACWLSPPSYFLWHLLLPLLSGRRLHPRRVKPLVFPECPSVLTSMSVLMGNRKILNSTTNKTLRPPVQIGLVLYQPVLLPTNLTLTFYPFWRSPFRPPPILHLLLPLKPLCHQRYVRG